MPTETRAPDPALMGKLTVSSMAIRNRVSLAVATAVCASVTLLAWPLSNAIDLANIVMVYLLAVVLIARYLGRIAAVWAAVLSVALFDFFFVPPQLSFAVQDIQYLVTFAVMLSVALIVGQLVAKINERAAHNAQYAEDQRTLGELARRLAGALTSSEAIAHATRHATEQFTAQLVVFVPDGTGAATKLRSMQVDGASSSISPEEQRAAESLYLCDSPTERFESDEQNATHYMSTMTGSTRRRGVVLLRESGTRGLRELAPSIKTFVALLTTVLERIHYVEVAQQSELEVKTQQLRGGLLAALSHDIRTPLTAIYGLADTLANDDTVSTPSSRESIVGIREQASTLNRMVSNLLELARLRSGRIELNREWQPIDEVIGASIRFVQGPLCERQIVVDSARARSWVDIDAVAMERVLCNLLDNANKYGRSDTPITIFAVVDESARELRIEVRNSGEHLPADVNERLFTIFERGEVERNADGLGVGLAICRALVMAHNGQIYAEAADLTTKFVIIIPLGIALPLDMNEPPMTAEGEA